MTARNSSRWINSSACAALHAPRAARAAASTGTAETYPPMQHGPAGRSKQKLPQATLDALELMVSSHTNVDWGGPHGFPTLAGWGDNQNRCSCCKEAVESLTTVVLCQPGMELRSLYKVTKR